MTVRIFGGASGGASWSTQLPAVTRPVGGQGQFIVDAPVTDVIWP